MFNNQLLIRRKSKKVSPEKVEGDSDQVTECECNIRYQITSCKVDESDTCHRTMHAQSDYGDRKKLWKLVRCDKDFPCRSAYCCVLS